jgi:hypothetical protein
MLEYVHQGSLVKGGLRDGVGSSSGGLPARSAGPDTNGSALDGVLSAELAHVAGVLCDLAVTVSGYPPFRVVFGYAYLHLLDLLTERGTVTGTVLSGDSNLLGALGHFGGCVGVG